MSARVGDARPLIAHVVYRFDAGGLENGIVNLINRLPHDQFRHAIVCLTEPGSFSRRLMRDDVELIGLHKRPGKDLRMYWRLATVLRRLAPAIVHTRNIGTLDCQIVATLMGVPVRLHGEHGWDVADLHGQNRRYRALRRWLAPWIRWFIPMSADLARWLERDVGIDRARIRQLYNGVDSHRFVPRDAAQRCSALEQFAPAGTCLFGSVMRLEAVKNPLAVVEAYAASCAAAGPAAARLRLIVVGGGPLEAAVRERVRQLGIDSSCWITGARDDVAELMQSMDVFVLASLNEGISNTILEAMACGLPVVATDVGGNRELVSPGQTGQLVPSGDAAALQQALSRYASDPGLARTHGAAGRALVERKFGIDAMIDRYRDLYLESLGPARLARATT